MVNVTYGPGSSKCATFAGSLLSKWSHVSIGGAIADGNSCGTQQPVRCVGRKWMVNLKTGIASCWVPTNEKHLSWVAHSSTGSEIKAAGYDLTPYRPPLDVWKLIHHPSTDFFNHCWLCRLQHPVRMLVAILETHVKISNKIASHLWNTYAFCHQYFNMQCPSLLMTANNNNYQGVTLGFLSTCPAQVATKLYLPA